MRKSSQRQRELEALDRQREGHRRREALVDFVRGVSPFYIPGAQLGTQRHRLVCECCGGPVEVRIVAHQGLPHAAPQPCPRCQIAPRWRFA